MRKIVFRKRWTSSFFVKQNGTSKSFCRNRFLVMKISTNYCKSSAKFSRTESTRKKQCCQHKREKSVPQFFQKKKKRFIFWNKKTTDRTKLREAESFFVLNGGKKLRHHAPRQEHWPLIDLLPTSTVSEHSCNLGELVVASHTAMYWICGTTTVLCTSSSSTMCKMTNSTYQTTVLSRP